MKKFKFELGVEVRDKITGFTGITTGVARYITGCDQYSVQPECKKKNEIHPEAYFIDEGKLELTNKRKKIELKTIKADDDGCDATAPVKC